VLGLQALSLKSQVKLASLMRTIFSKSVAEYGDHWHGQVVRMLECIHPKMAELLAEAKEDLLAFTSYPSEHW
jgi:transposase-like protein